MAKANFHLQRSILGVNFELKLLSNKLWWFVPKFLTQKCKNA